MRANANLFWILGGFFWLAAATYIALEPVLLARPGRVGRRRRACPSSGALSFFIAFYLGRTHAAQGGELPQDTPTAAIDDGDPEIGHFSPWSWWPFTLGVGSRLTFLGLAVGVWISLIGGPLVVVAVIGWNYEYYRNNFAR